MANKIREAVQVAITGRNAHVYHLVALEQLSAAQARKRPHPKVSTIWEQLGHMVFWQDIMIGRMKGKTPPPVPHDVDGWPKMPPVKGQEKAWAKLVKRFEAGLKEADRFAKRAKLSANMMPKLKRTFADQLMTIATHNSYHMGQIILLRKMLGLWPPPSGGDTW